MQIGQVIRTYRKKKNMTQEDMAIRLDSPRGEQVGERKFHAGHPSPCPYRQASGNYGR